MVILFCRKMCIRDRSVGPCILAMRMAFDKFKNFPGKTLKFIADGYTAYPRCV